MSSNILNSHIIDHIIYVQQITNHINQFLLAWRPIVPPLLKGCVSFACGSSCISYCDAFICTSSIININIILFTVNRDSLTHRAFICWFTPPRDPYPCFVYICIVPHL
eukprot:244516_1